MQAEMSMRNRIEPHLPHLRRYARALSGTREAGDDLVRDVLEALLDAPDTLHADADSRQELFRMFHAWHDPEHHGFGRKDGAVLPHRARQALLLTVVEGFSTAEAAHILGQTAKQVEYAIAEAHAGIAEMIRTQVLIIEDEPLIALQLEQLMQDMGHAVVATTNTCTDAVAAARTHAPGLVLADIQLADGSSGIDAANAILAETHMPVIFVTAFPERLLTGKPCDPAFLVTKPFKPDAVIATVAQALLARHPEFAPLS